MAPVNGTSSDAATAAVTGTHDNSGTGVSGSSDSGPGVAGRSAGGSGLSGESTTGAGVTALAHGTLPAFESINDNTTLQAGPGMRAVSAAAAVIGESSTWMGVVGVTQSSTGGNGVLGQGIGVGAGVAGTSTQGIGVLGQSSGINAPGVEGQIINPDGIGAAVRGDNNAHGPGVVGTSVHDSGLIGYHGDPHLQETTVGSEALRAAVFGASEAGAGVMGYTHDPGSYGIVAYGGLMASAITHPFAGEFFGNVRVHGDIFLGGGDCAEEFDLDEDEETAEPGDVVVISASGLLRRSSSAYQKTVAGVVSGAGSFRPGIVLNGDAIGPQQRPVALVGRVYCKVDARYGAVGVGDLLTSSDTPAHAMAATNRDRAFGCVLGKALGTLRFGQGLVPVLVCLQ